MGLAFFPLFSGRMPDECPTTYMSKNSNLGGKHLYFKLVYFLESKGF